jgi:ABC-type bacteriocin/lantibiotic exporter with double-glycine peptidase domain
VIVTTTFIAFTGATKLAQISILDSIQKKLFVRYAWIYKESISQLNNTMSASELSAKGRKFLDIVTLQKSFSKLLADFTKSALQIVVGILLLTVYHPVFLLVGIGITLAIVIGFRLTWKSGFETARQESTMKFKTYESILALTEVENDVDKEQIQLDNFHNSVDSYVKYREEHFKVLYRQAKFGIVTKTLLTAIMLIVGSYLLVNNQISLGQFLASEILIITLLDATEKLILSVENMYDSGTALEKLNSIDTSKKWEASI